MTSYGLAPLQADFYDSVAKAGAEVKTIDKWTDMGWQSLRYMVRIRKHCGQQSWRAGSPGGGRRGP